MGLTTVQRDCAACDCIVFVYCTMMPGIYCYACNSYLGQCGDRVDNSKGTLFRSRCSGPCFARRGEDDGENNIIVYSPFPVDLFLSYRTDSTDSRTI